jgi:hypothetical protein
MIEHIITEIRTNSTNGKCTDAETDCHHLTTHRGVDGNMECWEWCGLYGGDVSTGPVEPCLKRRAQVSAFLVKIHKDIASWIHLANDPFAIRIAGDIRTQLQELLGDKEPYCSRCGADPGDDSKCANCHDYDLFKEKKT